jgi:S1-C subfamily serine protease
MRIPERNLNHQLLKGNDLIKSIANIAKQVVRIEVTVGEKEGNGTGLVVSDDGRVLTCAHVVRPDGHDADKIVLRDVSGNRLGEPKTINADDDHDIAVLMVDGMKGSCEWAGYKEVEVGTECYVLGYPIGLRHLTVVKGMVSAMGSSLIRELPFEAIQIEGRVNRGNSGGPVVDIDSGKVFGIVSMRYIPFLTSVDELRRFTKSLPSVQSQGVAIMGINFGAFFNYVKEAFDRVTDALFMVQIGLAWVLPTDLFVKYLE